ncbi:MAG: hypothetical protein WCA13_06935 [Terriglobales bacterium]
MPAEIRLPVAEVPALPFFGSKVPGINYKYFRIKRDPSWPRRLAACHCFLKRHVELPMYIKSVGKWQSTPG